MKTKFVTVILTGSLGVLLLAQRGTAQIFPAQGDDTTSSMGVFRITVDPAFVPLVGAAGALVAYPGYNSVAGKLTSPLCVDNSTTIGRSGRNARPYVFPVPVGAGSWDSIAGYGDYAAVPALWSGAAINTEEVLTEIKSFILISVSPSTDGKQCPPDPRIPAVPLSWPMVRAGTFAGVSPRSLGMVQENVVNGPAAPDFPAHSFFDVFVELNLPQIAGTVSGTAFPATGAVLYNDSPLIITNLNLTGFPPQVVYIHGETTAVPLKFRTTRAPYWSAGDIFGYLILAGHGTITNDCSNTSAVNGLLDAALGPVGTTKPELPVEWVRTNKLCPSPNTTYDSGKGTNADGTTIDKVKFIIPGGPTLHARHFSHGNLTNPLNPPTPGNTTIYTAPNTVVSLEISLDGTSWSSAQATGPVTTKITNTTGTGSTSTFDTEMLQLSLSGTSQVGPFMLRESPTLISAGKHTIRTDTRGYRISSFFDVFLELSTDGGQTWIPADRSIRVQPSAPAAIPNSIFVTSYTRSNLVLNWLGNFTPQNASKVGGPYSDLSPDAISGPLTVPIATNQMYFRLRQ